MTDYPQSGQVAHLEAALDRIARWPKDDRVTDLRSVAAEALRRYRQALADHYAHPDYYPPVS